MTHAAALFTGLPYVRSDNSLNLVDGKNEAVVEAVTCGSLLHNGSHVVFSNSGTICALVKASGLLRISSSRIDIVDRLTGDVRCAVQASGFLNYNGSLITIERQSDQVRFLKLSYRLAPSAY